MKITFIIAILSVILGSLFFLRVRYSAPGDFSTAIAESDLIKVTESHYTLGNSWLRKNISGNWECYVEGSAYDRGITLGILQKKLIEKQEEVFIAEIEKNVPSTFMQRFLLAGIAWFNRDLDKSIPPEYLEEIYGISEYFSPKYDWVGPRFNRILNYHAAHDIGHAVQNMHLVGCTAFGSWDNNSDDPQMLFGRNFDFYFGDEFAKNKIVLFCNPDKGYSYSSVTWAGFSGVVSGMNEKGLGITLNSDKSEIPASAGTPVSIIAREILQYASNFKEAIAISKKYSSFVSESFAICSAYDSSIMVIEKTPDSLGFYYPSDDKIVVSNHFQSPELKALPINIEHIASSESKYRFERTHELLYAEENTDIEGILGILRNQKGLGDKNIGMGNPMAINQLLAHHAVIFKPYERLIWVSNYPFQEGKLDAYDLSKMGKYKTALVQFPISIDSLSLNEDRFLSSQSFQDFELYKKLHGVIKHAGEKQKPLENGLIDQFISANQNYYEVYRLAAWYFDENKDFDQAIEYYKLALSKEIPYLEDRIAIEKRLEEIVIQ